jgi:hypothetical protein
VRVQITYDEAGRVTAASVAGASPGAEAFAGTAVRVDDRWIREYADAVARARVAPAAPPQLLALPSLADALRAALD